MSVGNGDLWSNCRTILWSATFTNEIFSTLPIDPAPLKGKILQTDTRHHYDHLPMPQKFHPRHDWDEQFGLHKVTQLDSIGLIWEVSFVLSLFQPLFSLTFVFLDP